jgi:NADH-quinone oxidoreductase subunit L
MGVLAIGAIGLGALQIPGVTQAVHNFLEPTFEDSRYYAQLEPSAASSWIGLIVGTLVGLAGIAIAYQLWVKTPARPVAIRERLAALHGVLSHKWYFDELIDWLVVRPFGWFGRFARNTFERVVINGVFVGGTVGAVRAGSAAVRAAQSGYLRYYVTLLLGGVVALVLYFLIKA